jgi:hypothetical protein
MLKLFKRGVVGVLFPYLPYLFAALLFPSNNPQGMRQGMRMRIGRVTPLFTNQLMGYR